MPASGSFEKSALALIPSAADGAGMRLPSPD